jgi:hypothetical protein
MDRSLRLTHLAELGNGFRLYGLQYPGFHGCVSWCFLTIGPGVIVASQPERGDCGTSITNILDEYFIRLLEDLPEVGAAGSSPHWFEHYYGPEGLELDEVFLTPEGRVNWKFAANGVAPVAAAFERLTGEQQPDFAASAKPRPGCEPLRRRLLRTAIGLRCPDRLSRTVAQNGIRLNEWHDERFSLRPSRILDCAGIPFDPL